MTSFYNSPLLSFYLLTPTLLIYTSPKFQMCYCFWTSYWTDYDFYKSSSNLPITASTDSFLNSWLQLIQLAHFILFLHFCWFNLLVYLISPCKNNWSTHSASWKSIILLYKLNFYSIKWSLDIFWFQYSLILFYKFWDTIDIYCISICLSALT